MIENKLGKCDVILVFINFPNYFDSCKINYHDVMAIEDVYLDTKKNIGIPGKIPKGDQNIYLTKRLCCLRKS